MPSPDSGEFPQRERPKHRFRKESDWLVPAPPPAPPEEAQAAEAPAPYKLASWKDIEPASLPDHYRLAVFCGAWVGLALAVAVSWATVLAGLLMAVAVTASLGRLGGALAQVQVPRRFWVWAAAGIAVVALAVALLVWLAVWQRQATDYGARLTVLANELAAVAKQQRVDEPAQWVVNGAQAAETALATTAATVAGRRGALFGQVALLVAGFTVLAVFRPRAEAAGGLAKAWRVIGAVLANLFEKIGFAVSSRLGKAVALGVLAGVGLQIAGVTAAWFVAGCVLALAVALRSAPIVMVVGALPMIAWETGWVRSTALVVATGGALFFAEKKLYWYLCRRPALAAGIILPEVQEGSEAGGRRSYFGSLGQVLRGVSSLLMLGVIGVLLWVFVPAYQQQTAQTKAVAAATTHAELANLWERYPNEPEVLLKLVKAPDTTNAMEYADAYAGWEPQPVQAAGWREQLYRQALEFFGGSQPAFDRAAGYEYLLGQQPSVEEPADERRALAQKILALHPDHVIALNALAHECLLRNEPDQAIEYAERAVKLAPRDLTCRLVLADAYLAKKEWAKAIVECDAALALQPDNPHLLLLRALAAKSLQKNPN